MSAAYNAFPTETYSAAFGNLAVEYLPTNQIPNAVNIGRESCLQKCGINRQNYKQYFDPSKVRNKTSLYSPSADLGRSVAVLVDGDPDGRHGSLPQSQ